jgi:molybdopterin converting factor small subunit
MYVEFLGIPRERAGVADLELEARTFGDVIDTLADRFPALRELIAGGELHPSVVANLNGDEFVSDRHLALADGDRLLIMSADVGG